MGQILDSLPVFQSSSFPLYQSDEKVRGGCPNQCHQDIHARFLGVVDLEGGECGQKCSGEAEGRAAELVAQGVGDGDQQETQGHREAPHGEFAVAKESHPGPEQVIVAGRVDVPGSAGRHQSQAALGQPDAVALVVPKALAIQSVETEGSGEEQYGN